MKLMPCDLAGPCRRQKPGMPSGSLIFGWQGLKHLRHLPPLPQAYEEEAGLELEQPGLMWNADFTGNTSTNCAIALIQSNFFLYIPSFVVPCLTDSSHFSSPKHGSIYFFSSSFICFLNSVRLLYIDFYFLVAQCGKDPRMNTNMFLFSQSYCI